MISLFIGYQCNFLKLYFIVYTTTVVPIFSPFVPLHQVPILPQAVPLLLSMSLGHTYVLFGYCIPCSVLHIPLLFCNCQLVLINHFTFFTHSLIPLPSGNHLVSIYDSVSVVLVCLFCFDMYCHFIVHIFELLK